MTQIVVYDANVLYPSALRDILIRVGLAKVVQPKWTDRILDEVFDHLVSNRTDLDPEKLLRTRTLMNEAIRDVLVEGYERIIEQLTLPDPDDRHVLAAAVYAEATVIVTKNLKDFTAAELSKRGITAKHPDRFLTELMSANSVKVIGVLEDMAQAWRSPTATVTTISECLRNEVPDFSQAVLDHLSRSESET